MGADPSTTHERDQLPRLCLRAGVFPPEVDHVREVEAADPPCWVEDQTGSGRLHLDARFGRLRTDQRDLERQAAERDGEVQAASDRDGQVIAAYVDPAA